jgi:hypothetical protein
MLKTNDNLLQMHVRGSVVDQVNASLHTKKKRKFLQFVTIFHLLQQGHPLTNYENM